MDIFSFIVAGIMVYIAIAVFIIGMIFRIISWFRVPKSSVRLGLFPKPKTRVGRFFKVLKDSFLFPQSYSVDKVTPIVKTKYRLGYSYTFILETIRSLLKYISAGVEYPRAECSL